MFFYKPLILIILLVSSSLIARGGDFRGGDFRGEENFHPEGSPTMHQQEYKAEHPAHPYEGQNRYQEQQLEKMHMENNWQNAVQDESNAVVPVETEAVTPAQPSNNNSSSQEYNFFNDYND